MAEIKGRVFRIRNKDKATRISGAWLVETSRENALDELRAFCAEKIVEGHIITTVTEVTPIEEGHSQMFVKGPELDAMVNELRAKKKT